MPTIAKSILTFLILAMVIAKMIKPEMIPVAEDSWPMLAIPLLIAMTAMWLVRHLHFLLAAVILFAVVLINLPRGMLTGGVHHEVVFIALLLVVSLWIAVDFSRLAALLLLAPGLAYLMPNETFQNVQTSPTLLTGAIIAMILTPLLLLIFRRRPQQQPPKSSSRSRPKT